MIDLQRRILVGAHRRPRMLDIEDTTELEERQQYDHVISTFRAREYPMLRGERHHIPL